jgi:hypothetical protein
MNEVTPDTLMLSALSQEPRERMGAKTSAVSLAVSNVARISALRGWPSGCRAIPSPIAASDILGEQREGIIVSNLGQRRITDTEGHNLVEAANPVIISI